MADDTTNCPVCFEPYEETREHLPRLLPCSHTICEKCVRKLLKGTSLTCPECRKKHPAEDKVRTFPQNKYILTHIKKRSQDLAAGVEKCKEHGKDLVFYCKEPGCQRSICSSCLLQSHRSHDVVENQGEITKDANVPTKQSQEVKDEALREFLQSSKAKLLTIKEEMKESFNNCVAEIKSQKDEQVRILAEKYDKMMKDATDQMEKINTDINDDVVAVDGSIELLDSLTKGGEAEEAAHERNAKTTEIINDLEVQAKKRLSAVKVFKYYEYNKSPVVYSAYDVERLCGNLKQKEKRVSLLHPENKTEDVTTPNDLNGANLPDAPRGNIAQLLPEVLGRTHQDISAQLVPSGLTYQVVQTINTKMHDVFVMTPSDSGDIIVCGKVKFDPCKLVRYNLQTGGESYSTTLADPPGGAAFVTMDEQKCLALSYGDDKKIEFRRLSDLGTVAHRCSVAPHKPVALCTSSPSTLLYVDTYKKTREVRWLDCRSSLSPTDVKVSHTKQRHVQDMCYAQHGDKQLLVTTHAYDRRLCAFNTSIGEQAWTVKGKYTFGIATDGRGHLFVCDSHSARVQIYSLDGSHVGCLLREGEQGLGKPVKIRWCSHTSSLIVGHVREDLWHISAVNVQ